MATALPAFGCPNAASLRSITGKETGLQHLPPGRAQGLEGSAAAFRQHGIGHAARLAEVEAQTVVASPIRPVIGQTQASEGSAELQSATNAAMTHRVLRHFCIILFYTINRLAGAGLYGYPLLFI